MKEKFIYIDEFGIKNYTPLYRLSVSTLYLFFLMALFSFLVGLCESGVNPNLTDTVDIMWYGHAVITTIGFGDITPVTLGGKILTVVFSIPGITLLVSMGRSLDEFMFGHTETGVRNRELMKQLKRDIELNEANKSLNEAIVETNNEAILLDKAILSELRREDVPRY